MFRTMKNAMVVGVIAVASAAAPAVASGDTWTTDGVSPYAGSAHLSGALTETIAANGSTITCDITGTADLSNPGGLAAGSIGSYVFGAAAGGSCMTSVPGCSITAAAGTLPWEISTSGTSLTFSGASLTYVFSGVSCPLNGISFATSGSITGSVSGDVITFASASGTTSSFGPTVVSGSLTIADTSGNPIMLM